MNLCLIIALLTTLLFPQVTPQVGYNVTGTDVTIVTTAETVIVTSAAVTVPTQTAHIVIIAYAQLTTGAGTTAVTPRIRRGTTATGTLVGEGNAVTIGAVAGSTENYSVMVWEDRASVAAVQYSLTLVQTGATGNGTAVQGGILVLVL